MINNIFPFPVQAAVQSISEDVKVPAFESASLWIDDLITLWLVFGY